MSGPRFSALPPDALKDKRLLDTDRDVLNDLGLHADTRTGWCFRAQKSLAEAIGVSRRTAQRSLDRLVELGYLEREFRLEKGRGQKSNLYRVLFEISGRRGQLDLFETDADAVTPASPKTKSAPRHDAPPRHAHGVNDAPPASCAGGKWRTIERPSLNDGYAAVRNAPANDEPKIDPKPDAVPVTEAPGAVPTSKSDLDRLEARLVAAAGDALDPQALGLRILTEPLGWIQAGCDVDADIVPTIAGLCARPRTSPVRSWSYFAGAVRQARDRRLAAARPADPPSTNIVPFDPRGVPHAQSDRDPRRLSRADKISAAFARRMGVADPE